EVDDVDAVALGEDVALHLRVPAPGLVPKVNATLEQLPHRDDGHGESRSLLSLVDAAERVDPPPWRPFHRPLGARPGRDQGSRRPIRPSRTVHRTEKGARGRPPVVAAGGKSTHVGRACGGGGGTLTR